MPRAPDAPPADAAPPAALTRLGDLLRSEGYTEQAVRERLSLDDTLLSREAMSIGRRRPRRDRLSDLIGLFLLHDRVAERAVDPDGVDFLERGEGGIVSAIAVQPWQGVLVAHDWHEGLRGDDHVAGAGGSTATLAAMTVRRQVRSALDLCAGSGVQAMLASRHSERVVGVELGARALRFGEWALALNGVTNVELRQGDARNSCEGERFDLVTANPPFVVSPERRWLFRDGGGDISRALIERAPGLLDDGGYAHVIGQWGVAAGESWDEQPRSWTSDRGCDVWILHLPTEEDVFAYTATWNESLETAGRAELEQAVDEWLGYFAAQGIERVVSGLVVLRRREGATWVRTDEAAIWPVTPAGEDVERLFAGMTRTVSLDDGELLDLRLRPAPEVRLDLTRAAGEHGFELVAAQARNKLPLRTKVNRAALGTLERLDGRVRLRDLPDAPTALPAVRELLATGMLTVDS